MKLDADTSVTHVQAQGCWQQQKLGETGKGPA